MNKIIQYLRRDSIPDMALEVAPVGPVLLVGADPQNMLDYEERTIVALEDRRKLIEDELIRLQESLRDTNLAIEARTASKMVLIRGGALPSHV